MLIVLLLAGFTMLLGSGLPNRISILNSDESRQAHHRPYGPSNPRNLEELPNYPSDLSRLRHAHLSDGIRIQGASS